MKRLLFLGGEEAAELLALLRRESPSLACCASLDKLPQALREECPRLVVSSLHHAHQVAQTVEILNQLSSDLPLVVVCEHAIAGPARHAVLEHLGERGTLLSPAESTSLRATLRSWLQPSPDPGMLDSKALARVYARGGRALADRLVESFLSAAPVLASKSRECWQRGEAQGCINCLESLGQQAGSLGAVDVAEAVEEMLDELIEGGQVNDDQWDTLNKALESSARFLAEQKRQDRTV